jgi:phage terminase large subunit-like protein
VYLGFDLSEVRDLTARACIVQVDGKWRVQAKFWLPEEGIRERSRKDRVPYDTWAEQGYIELVPGRTVSYQHVAADTAALLRMCSLAHAGFDRWNWRHFRPWLIKAGVGEATLEKRFHEFGMGEVSMTPALRTLEGDLLDGKIEHDGNPVLTMCMSNAVIHASPTGSRKLDKAHSRGRIDGAVALVIARGVAAEHDKSSKAGIKVL